MLIRNMNRQKFTTNYYFIRNDPISSNDMTITKIICVKYDYNADG